MILVCLGTSEFDFSRLLKIIDELCEEKIIEKKKIIAQIGNSSYKPKNYKSFNSIPREEFNKYIEEADFIISHAGTGTVVSAVKKEKKVIIFPRLMDYGEHQDNHQLELANTFSQKKYTLKALNKGELIDCINNLNKFKPNKFISNNKKINQLIIDFIEK